MKVLYLTPWYPSERDAMAGLFVQKHADAVRAQGIDVRVIHSLSWHDTWQQWRTLKREWGLPDLVQLNVVQKQGLLAYALQRRYGIPYIIVEHWSGYLPENGQYMQMPALKRRFYALIVRQASTLLCVSNRLADAMRACGLSNPDTRKINNVVDDFFYSAPQDYDISTSRDSDISTSRKTKTLLHVSCFDERAKNVKGLLRAARMLAAKRQDWRLVLVGTGIDYKEVRAYADELNFPEGLLCWTGELTPQEVAEQMRQAEALVLSSRYETYGIILAEAVATGLPILSTPVGIAEETGAHIVTQEIAQQRPELFAEYLEKMLFSDLTKQSENDYYSEQFTAEAVGRQLKQIYEQCLLPA